MLQKALTVKAGTYRKSNTHKKNSPIIVIFPINSSSLSESGCSVCGGCLGRVVYLARKFTSARHLLLNFLCTYCELKKNYPEHVFMKI